MASIFVHLGFWTNWSHGQVLGATVTVPIQYSNYLNSFLAVFITYVSGQFWRIVCFAAHQISAQDRPVDALHHQRQTIFRNTGSAGGGVWEFLLLMYKQRKYTRHAVRRSLAWVIMALTVVAGFGAAGTFSSSISKSAGTAALIKSSSCGFWDRSLDTSQQYLQKTLDDTIMSSGYARACYGTEINLLRCNRFVTQDLPYTSSSNGPCPFTSGICSNRAPVFTLESDPLDSNDHFGMNAPRENRLMYRKRTSCSILNLTNEYVKQENITIQPDNRLEPFLRFYLGPLLNYSDFTYSYFKTVLSSDVGYLVNAYSATAGLAPNPKSRDWDPIANLSQTDAEVSVVFLASNGINYLSPVTDPLFAATEAVSYDGGRTTFYRKEKYVAGLGCIDQHQFCNNFSTDTGSGHRCTNYTGYHILGQQLEALELNPYQKAAADVLLDILIDGTIASSIGYRGADALLAQQGVTSQYQTAIPNNQWMIEVQSWFATALARMQVKTVEYATGPLDGLDLPILPPPNDTAGKHVCSNIKIPELGRQQNFSVLGLALILSLGGLIIIVSFTLPFCASFIQKALRIGEGQRLQWIYDDKMRMQQMAFESKGIHVWRDDLESWPVTLKRDRFLPLGHFAKRQSSINLSGIEKDEQTASLLKSDSLLSSPAPAEHSNRPI